MRGVSALPVLDDEDRLLSLVCAADLPTCPTANREPDELKALTAQRRRILELIAEGMTNRQIGQELFLAEKTVTNCVSSLLG